MKLKTILIILIFNILVFSFDLSKSDDELFNDFKMKFAKKYKNVEEELKRKLLFIERLKIIRNNNNNPNRLNTFGINKFTDRFDDELPKTGLKHNLKKLKNLKNVNDKLINELNLKNVKNIQQNENLKSALTIDIPDSYFSCDRINNLCGEIIHQGICGSCYAAAIANDAQIRYNYIMKYSYLSNEKMNDKFSIQYLIDCGGNNGCGGGASDDTILEAKYLYLEKDYPYIDYNVDSDNEQQVLNNIHECSLKNNTKPIMGVYDLTYFSNLDWESIKALIYNKGSFITAIYVSDDFDIYYNPLGIWNCDVNIQEVGTNHAVVVDGYGEETINNERIKYLWVRNSWGDDWGYNGHFRINFDKSCGINDKIDLGFKSEYLKGTYLIQNFVPAYIINEDYKNNKTYEDNSNDNNKNSENNDIGIIICCAIIGILLILFIASLITITVLSILLHKYRT